MDALEALPRQFLIDVEKLAAEHGRNPGFQERVRQRIARAQAEYGDSWRNRPVSELVAEIVEEGVDTAAWAALVAARGDLDGLAYRKLLETAALGCLAELWARELRGML